MKRVIAFLLLLVLLTSNSITFAIDNGPTEDLHGDNITISGKLNIARKKQVTIQVLKPGKSIEQLYGDEALSFTEVIAYQDQVESSQDGSYVFDFVIKSDTPDTYEYFITSTGYEVSDEFDYYGAFFTGNIMGQINSNRSNSGTVHSLISDNYAKINLSAPIYQKALEDMPDKTTELYTIFAKYDSADSTKDLSTQLDKSAATLYINEVATQDDMINEIGTYADVVEIADKSAYTVYTEMLSTKPEILSAVISELMTDHEDDKAFAKAFEETVILTTLEELTTWSDMKQFLEITSDVTGIDFTNCNELDYPEKVYLSLLGTETDKVEKIAGLFDKAVEAREDIENGGSDKKSPGALGGAAGLKTYAPNNNINEGSIAQENAAGFKDLANYEWAKEDIYFLKEKGIIAGKTNDTFDPAADITREEFVKLLVLTANVKKAETTETFSDVVKGSWYEEYVNTGVSAGLIKGIGDKKFGVGEAIKREDMAVMVKRLLEKASASVLDDAKEVKFNDEMYISDYALDAVKQLSGCGVLLGTDNGLFAPKNNVTRAQAAVLLRRVYNLVQGEV